jgi:hypothetical protein
MKKFLKLLMLSAAIGYAAISAKAQVGISVRVGPPALPVYVQPPCPVDGYLWQPGYWAYDNADGYYWVPGEWVAPPDPGLLWTPCYWGWDNGVYLFHAGYWGPHVGFYGGINYGFGYPGSGFYGGVWSGRSFRYNTAVFNVNRTVIHNTYINRSIPRSESRVSYNGGRGGINRQPDANERRYSSERHVAATRMQIQHQQAAGRDPGARFAANHGRPANLVNHPDARMANQQARISNGIAHGTMTGRETHHVENREANVNREVNHDRAANNGRLTPAEHQQVNRQQNNISHAINRDNHNTNNAPRMQPQHVSQPEQHVNRMPAQPQQHMGGGGFGGGRPAGPPAGGGMPHGGGFGGGAGRPVGGPPAGGGGHPMGGHGHHP